MRKVIVGVFVSLDGVMQAPGGPEEDPTGGFRFGGWIVPYRGNDTGDAVGSLFAKPFDLLLGRTTYDIFAAYWPYYETDPAAPGDNAGGAHIATTFNAATKFVATHHPETMTWQNSKALGPDVAGAVRDLKKTDGPDLVVQGSTELIHILLAADLVDHMQLLIYPVIFGKGKRLFDAGSAPRALKLTDSKVSSDGVIIAKYDRAGEPTTGSFVGPDPSAAELERRRRMKG
jgi:dihydrofolate reductase